MNSSSYKPSQMLKRGGVLHTSPNFVYKILEGFNCLRGLPKSVGRSIFAFCAKYTDFWEKQNAKHLPKSTVIPSLPFELLLYAVLGSEKAEKGGDC
jgi:hypothetical protein